MARCAGENLPPATRRSRAEKIRPNNKTGVPGVFPLLSTNGKMLGWLARTYIAHDQILRALFVTDGQGGAARSMAIREREWQLDQMSGLAKVHPAEEAIRNAPARPTAALLPKRSPSEIVRKNNRSGIPGVTFKAPRREHPGYWMAITYTAGKGSVSKAFSVAKHGHDKARTLAVAERQRQLKQKNREDIAA
ncbi:AP2 domain-containing protein [Variovorax sp. ZS18.2.2]|uniref:AP2 domain-containing protein n=1 Tax=Variovorax sp. ZS18.2.2 TaxID=2971255 RepID=UPI002150925F|nr:AP2 domain-containing protein [Variovorax sp. ZS18.2.2]MCR6474752.1 AP2 domain-containing protein [Variovorax sp. ZS18.2.2]